jgi:hypothetical protein
MTQIRPQPKPTPAKRQAAEFIARAKALKAARIPDDDSTMGRLRAVKASEATT